MKSDRLQDAIGGAQPEFIEDAELLATKKSFALKKWLAAAACLLIATVIAMSFVFNSKAEADKSPTAPDGALTANAWTPAEGLYPFVGLAENLSGARASFALIGDQQLDETDLYTLTDLLVNAEAPVYEGEERADYGSKGFFVLAMASGESHTVDFGRSSGVPYGEEAVEGEYYWGAQAAHITIDGIEHDIAPAAVDALEALFNKVRDQLYANLDNSLMPFAEDNVTKVKTITIENVYEQTHTCTDVERDAILNALADVIVEPDKAGMLMSGNEYTLTMYLEEGGSVRVGISSDASMLLIGDESFAHERGAVDAACSTCSAMLGKPSD